MLETAINNTITCFASWLIVMFFYYTVKLFLSFRIEKKGLFHNNMQKIISYLLGVLVATLCSIIIGVFLKEKIIILSIFILTSSSSLFAVFNLYNEENKK